MRRAFVDPSVLAAASTSGASLTLPADAAHRFFRVLRLPDGEQVELFDGSGRLLRGRLRAPDSLEGVEVHAADDALPPLVVAQALVKTDKLELVVQKGTELGASAFVLFDAERGQVDWQDRDKGKARSEGKAERRLERLGRIAGEAARQAGRARVPTVSGPESLSALAARVQAFTGVAVVGVPGAEAPLSEVLAADARRGQGLLVVVGPEGGLSPAELERLRAAGAIEVRLGAFVLRTETAALAALAAAQAALGHL